MAGGNSGGNAPIINNAHDRPKTLLAAIAEIEIISTAEESGTELPERFATLQDTTDYSYLGFKSVVGGTILSLILAPVSSAVITQNLPIFGHTEPDIYDMILSYVISFGYSIGYMMLFLYVAKLRGGRVSNKITNSLMIGMSGGAFIKGVIAGVVYGFLYFKILTDENIRSAISLLSFFELSTQTYNAIWYIVTTLRNALIPAIYIYAITCGIIIILPWTIRIYSRIRYKMREDV